MKNNKGFALTEVLILSAVVIGLLTFMYIQFKNINRGYQYSFKYDTVEGMYLANNILNYIKEDNYDKLIEILQNRTEGYLDITDCNINIFETNAFCEQLFEKSKIKQIIFTEENLFKIKNNMANLDNETKKYINQIKTLNSSNDYRIIIKYDNDTFATMRFNKGNAYVQRDLITHLDGINNTGNGHSSNINTWKDLSGHNTDATLYNNPIWNNKSITFDGIDDYGIIENTENMEFAEGLTLETRVKILSTENGSARNYLMFIDNVSSTNPADGISIYVGKAEPHSFIIRQALKNSNTYTITRTSTSNDMDKYYTIAATYDNKNAKLYIDGELIQTVDAPGEYSISPNPIYLSLQYLDTTYSNVEIQNVLIYERALSDTEIKRNYQADISRY